MAAIQIAAYRFRLARPIRAHEAPALRGFFGRKFEDEVLMHDHGPDGEPTYQYPRVQFKVLDRTAVLLGINEGSQLLQRLWLDVDETELGDEQLSVLESELETRETELEVTSDPIEYRFATAWLARRTSRFRPRGSW